MKILSEKDLLLVELNEVNFDLVRSYVDKYDLPGFKKLFQLSNFKTTSEDQYELLEPWIQWPSIHTGKTAKEHGIFRLGDIVDSNLRSIFNLVESLGKRVGVVSAMNVNNNLENPEYFIPDPWTSTSPGKSFWERNITRFLRQTVNDNSEGKITLVSLFLIALTFIRFAKVRNYNTYLKLGLSSLNKPWRKALFLDLLIHDIHLTLFLQKKPNLSAVFFNAGAHIQHHYFYNSLANVQKNTSNPSWYVSNKQDPFLEMLHVYDRVLLQLFEHDNFSLVLATGLTQKPSTSNKFYYRLKDHGSFLNSVGVNFSKVHPRMTRDFLIEFNNKTDSDEAFNILSKIRVNKNGSDLLFGHIENRGTSIFLSLDYSKEITAREYIKVGGDKIPLKNHVVFVAIKNGEHDPKGFVFLSDNFNDADFLDGSHVSKIFYLMKNYFLSEENPSDIRTH